MKKLAVLVVLILLGAPTQALYVTTADGNGADGWISNDNQSSSYHSDTVHNTTGMQVRYNGGGSRFRAAFLRFDISGVTEEFPDTAALTLGQTFAKGAARTIQIYGLVDGDAGEAWDDTTLSYINAPGFIDTAPNPMDSGYFAIDSRLVLLGDFVIPAAPAGTPTSGATLTIPRMISSSSLLCPLADFLNADTNGLVTLVLINATGTSGTNSENRFASEEDSKRWAIPALIPEPATMLMLGLGGLLAIRKKA